MAVALGVSVATFDVVLHRALASLKKALASGQPEPKEESVMKGERKLRLVVSHDGALEASPKPPDLRS